MPKKRRKRIATSIAPDIPYPRVRVEWIDCISDSGWATEKEFDKIKNLLSCLRLTIRMRTDLLLEIGR